MYKNSNLNSETQSALAALVNFELVDLVRYNPVEAHGWLDSLYWYFQAHGPAWSFEIGGSPNFTEIPSWWHEERWGQDDVSAGYMTEEEAISCILKSIEIYKSADRSKPKLGDPEYADHVMRAWSAGKISAAKAGEALSLNVIEVVGLGLAKGFPQPWTAKHEVDRYTATLAAARNDLLSQGGVGR